MISVDDPLRATQSHDRHSSGLFDDESHAENMASIRSKTYAVGRISSQVSSPDEKLHRTRTSMRIQDFENQHADDGEEAAPAWLLAAEVEYPNLTRFEIKTVREMFEQHAISMPDPSAPGGARLSITREALANILDESLQSFFDEIDLDGNGSLEREEVAKLVGKLGRPMSSAELDVLMQDLDLNGDGGVEYPEFKAWYQNEEDTECELDDMFSQVDDDFSGHIEWGEFVQMIGRNIEHVSTIARMESGEPAVGGPEQPLDSPSKDGKTRPRSLTSSFKERDPATLVRQALESVRSDIRAIYGTSAHNRPALQLATEEEREAANRRCFFRPDGSGWTVKFKKSWDIVQVGILIYVAVMVPFRIGFRQELSPSDAMFWIDVAVDAYFWFDIFLNFRTAYRDDRSGDNVLVVDLKEIRMRYVRSWFFIDLVSCLPIVYIELLLNSANDSNGSEQGNNVKILKALRLMRLAKLLRLARVKRVLERLEAEYAGLAQVTKMIKINATIIFTAHFVACLWFYVGDSEPESIGIGPDGTELILTPWVRRQNWPPNVGLFTKYLDAFYYSVTTLTTVGYGDRTPTTDSEKVFSIIAELAGCVIFGIVAGSLGALAMSTTMSEREMKYQREQLREFLNSKRIGVDLQNMVLGQMENWWAKKSVFDERQLLDRLPPKHRKMLLMRMYRPSLVNSPLLKGVEDGILTKLCMVMRPYLSIEGDQIVRENDVGEEIFILITGCIKLHSDRYPLYSKRKWTDGAFFGELTVLGLGEGPEHDRHVYSVTSVGDSDCTFITKASLMSLFDQHLAVHGDVYSSTTLEDKMRDLAIQRASRFGHFKQHTDHGSLPGLSEDQTRAISADAISRETVNIGKKKDDHRDQEGSMISPTERSLMAAHGLSTFGRSSMYTDAGSRVTPESKARKKQRKAVERRLRAKSMAPRSKRVDTRSEASRVRSESVKDTSSTTSTTATTAGTADDTDDDAETSLASSGSDVEVETDSASNLDGKDGDRSDSPEAVQMELVATKQRRVRSVEAHYRQRSGGTGAKKPQHVAGDELPLPSFRDDADAAAALAAESRGSRGRRAARFSPPPMDDAAQMAEAAEEANRFRVRDSSGDGSPWGAIARLESEVQSLRGLVEASTRQLSEQLSALATATATANANVVSDVTHVINDGIAPFAEELNRVSRTSAKLKRAVLQGQIKMREGDAVSDVQPAAGREQSQTPTQVPGAVEEEEVV